MNRNAASHWQYHWYLVQIQDLLTEEAAIAGKKRSSDSYINILKPYKKQEWNWRIVKIWLQIQIQPDLFSMMQ